MSEKNSRNVPDEGDREPLPAAAVGRFERRHGERGGGRDPGADEGRTERLLLDRGPDDRLQVAVHGVAADQLVRAGRAGEQGIEIAVPHLLAARGVVDLADGEIDALQVRGLLEDRPHARGLRRDPERVAGGLAADVGAEQEQPAEEDERDHEPDQEVARADLGHELAARDEQDRSAGGKRRGHAATSVGACPACTTSR